MKQLDIGAIMRAARVRAGLSQEEMAARINYGQSDVSKFELGHKEPPIHTFVRWFDITNAKEVAVAYLCGIDGIGIMQQIMSMIPT